MEYHVAGFNPIVRTQRRIGEDRRHSHNLLPFVAQVAVGRRPSLAVSATITRRRHRHATIHVVDLALGHPRRLTLRQSPVSRSSISADEDRVSWSGRRLEQASGRKVPYTIQARRPGDVAECWADPSKAERELGWRATRDLRVMCEDAWRWQFQNPNGFAEA